MNFRLLGISIAALEWYDILLATTLANIFSEQFFPTSNGINSYILYLSSIALSYLGRPLGAFLFGSYADKNNRIKACYYSFLLISISTILIAFLPTYKTLGIIAPIMLVALRFIQSIGLAGNNNLWVISTENEIKGKYFASSLLTIGFILGSLSSSFLVAILFKIFNNQTMLHFGWRIPYFISIIFSIFIIIGFNRLDKKLLEKRSNIKSNKIKLEKKTIMKIIKTFFLLFGEIILFYLFFIFFTNYKTIFLNKNISISWFHYTIGMVAMLVATPIFGKLADQYGCIRSLRISSIATFIFWGIFSYLNVNFQNIFYHNMIYVSIIFGILQAVTFGSLYGYVPSVFEPEIRSRASSITISLASTLCASLIPLICAKLAYYNIKYVFWCFSIIFLVKIFFLYSFKDEKDNILK